jgi:hypothetical protein
VTEGDGASNSAIRGYAPKTSNVGTSPLGLAVSLIALNTICSTMSLSMSGISVVIIW